MSRQSKQYVTRLNRTIELKVIVESTYDGMIKIKTNHMPIFHLNVNWFSQELIIKEKYKSSIPLSMF